MRGWASGFEVVFVSLWLICVPSLLFLCDGLAFSVHCRIVTLCVRFVTLCSRFVSLCVNLCLFCVSFSGRFVSLTVISCLFAVFCPS